jgi:hypothetical protein
MDRQRVGSFGTGPLFVRNFKKVLSRSLNTIDNIRKETNIIL